MAISSTFVNRPPTTITGPFEFTITATNTGPQGDDFAFEAVAIDPATGEQVTRIWSTNVYIQSGQTRELTFSLLGTRDLDIPDGQYDLNVLYGDYPTPTNWKSAINTTVEFALSGSGGTTDPAPGDDDSPSDSPGSQPQPGDSDSGTNPALILGGIGALAGLGYAMTRDGNQNVPSTTVRRTRSSNEQ